MLQKWCQLMLDNKQVLAEIITLENVSFSSCRTAIYFNVRTNYVQ